MTNHVPLVVEPGARSATLWEGPHRIAPGIHIEHRGRSTDSKTDSMKKIRLLSISLFSLVALVVAACTQTETPPATPVANQPLHALMIDRIDNLYRRIDILTFDQDRTPLELDRARRRGSEEVAQAARELAASVGLLEQAGESLNLSPQQLLQFRAMANELRDASEALALSAISSEDDLTPALNNLQQTCAACHALYRDR